MTGVVVVVIIRTKLKLARTLRRKVLHVTQATQAAARQHDNTRKVEVMDGDIMAMRENI